MSLFFNRKMVVSITEDFSSEMVLKLAKPLLNLSKFHDSIENFPNIFQSNR